MVSALGPSDGRLDRSNDDLECLVDELTALNSHLRRALLQQRRTAAGLQGALTGLAIAIILLDTVLCIRFFTPCSRRHCSLLQCDIGRPNTDLARRFSD